MNLDNFAKKLVDARKKKNLTQEQLALKLNVERSAISRWERGVTLPDFDLMCELAKVLDFSVDEILHGEIKKKKSLKYLLNKSVPIKYSILLLFLPLVLLICISIFVTINIVNVKNDSSFVIEELYTKRGMNSFSGYFISYKGETTIIIDKLNYNYSGPLNLNELESTYVSLTLMADEELVISVEQTCNSEYGCTVNDLFNLMGFSTEGIPGVSSDCYYLMLEYDVNGSVFRNTLLLKELEW